MNFISSKKYNFKVYEIAKKIEKIYIRFYIIIKLTSPNIYKLDLNE